MSRLTLRWHLRGIIEGTTDGEVVRVDIEPGSHYKRREWRVTKRYYSDPTDEDRKRVYESQHDAGSYTTGFEQDSGNFCTALDVPASAALRSDDPVTYLDRVAHDPTRRPQVRWDTARLLDWHIWPDAPDAGTLGRSDGLCGHADRSDVDVSEWLDAGMVAPSIGPQYSALQCSGCTNSETLADPDVLRDTGQAVCMACGTEQEIPDRGRA